MSANQIPAPSYSSPDRSIHSCPDCWRNGGPGHHLDRVIDSFGPTRRLAGYAGPIKTTRAVQSLPAWAATTRRT